MEAPAAGEDDVASIYSLAYRRVFQSSAPDSVPEPLCRDVRGMAKDLRVPVETFVYACLMGHKVSCPERRFRAQGLVSESAAKRVQFYRSKAVERFGTMDVGAVTMLSGKRDSVAEEVGRSEELFGGWVVGARVERGGNGVGSLYLNRELALSPYWLATEASYLKWRAEQPGGTPEVQRHRRSVAAVPAESMPELLRIRGSQVQRAVSAVLHRRGVRPSQLLTEPVITNAFRLWLSIGDALLQLRMLDQVERARF